MVWRPSWCRTAGDCIASGTLIKIACGRCGTLRKVDLTSMVPETVLWNRRPPCPICGQARVFLAFNGVYRPMVEI